MRALSLWRPWPWAFFHAGKRIENRSWRPPASILGEWVAMHASLTFDHGAAKRMRDGAFGNDAAIVPFIPRNHATGIVGAFRVSGAFMLDQVGAYAAQEIHDAARSRFAFGPWCWLTPDVIELPEPIPCKGKQGLWTVPAGIEARLRARIAEAA